MDDFLNKWGEAANTSLGFFWMALWAFALGYVISSCIQVFVTEKRMQKTMGKNESKGVLLGTFFGFISSSCSFAALASTKSLFKKGASFVASIAFLLASTNLVIELGIIISIFLGWQFVVGEYLGGILLILISWLLIRLFHPKGLIKKARERLKDNKDDDANNQKSWKERIKTEKSWAKVSQQYGMEWKMVWKDVTLGFTIAGIVAAFIPDSFFQTLFINSGQGNTDFSFFTIFEHITVGPLVAFITFIGSMGNIPLAALLFGKGVSFAGVMAFIFSDLVVFPVLRIQAQYYGWKMAIYILIVFLCALVGVSLVMHYGLDLLGHLPDASGFQSMTDREFFNIDYAFFLNVAFLTLTGAFIFWHYSKKEKSTSGSKSLGDWVLLTLSIIAYVWLAIGIAVLPFL